MKILLFPSWCRILGWIVFLPSFVVAIAALLFGGSFVNDYSELISRCVLAGLSLGALLIVCSKAKFEDELSLAVRQASLFNSFFAFVVLVVAFMLITEGTPLLNGLIACVGLFPVIAVGNFALEMYSFKRQEENEKSGED